MPLIELTPTGTLDTAVNVGNAGLGVFKQKTSLSLELRKINVGSTKLTINSADSGNVIVLDLGTLTASDIPNLDASKITTGLIPWSRIDGSTANITGGSGTFTTGLGFSAASRTYAIANSGNSLTFEAKNSQAGGFILEDWALNAGDLDFRRILVSSTEMQFLAANNSTSVLRVLHGLSMEGLTYLGAATGTADRDLIIRGANGTVTLRCNPSGTFVQTIQNRAGTLAHLDQVVQVSNNLSEFSGSPATARSNLGLVIGTNVQAWNAGLDSISALATTSFGRSLLTQADAAASRTTLGLVIGTNVQAWDSDLDSIAALTTTSFGRSLLTQADAAALRTAAALGSISTQNSTAVAITGGTVTGLSGLSVNTSATQLLVPGSTGNPDTVNSILEYRRTGAAGLLGMDWSADGATDFHFRMLLNGAGTQIQFTGAAGLTYLFDRACTFSNTVNTNGLSILTNGALQTAGVGGGSVVGNARGTGAVDLQVIRTAATQVAAGNYSFTAGNSCTASGNNSIAFGNSNVASGSNSIAVGASNSSTTNSSFAHGYQSVARRAGSRVFSSGRIAADGDAQAGELVLRATVTSTTLTELLGGLDSQRLVLQDDMTLQFYMMLVMRRADGNDESAAFEFRGCVDRNVGAGTAAFVGAISKTVLARDVVAWDVTVDVDTTNGSVRVRAQAEAGKTVYAVAYVTYVEVIA